MDSARYPCVFIVGAPRSGTTYVQNLIGSHPLVVTSQETDLFAQYIAPLRARWEFQLPSDPEAWTRWRHKGLPAVFTEEEFDSVITTIVDRVHSRTLALKLGAKIWLTKVPQNCQHAELILRYIPQARFIHVLRDGRDVVASQLRAARGWGRDWAPQDVCTAATCWRTDVQAGRSIRRLTDAYLEVRYEELISPTAPALLRQVWAFLGVDAGEEECARRCAEFNLNREGGARSSLVWGGEVIRRLQAPPAEPPGFAGEGGVGAWAQEFDSRSRSAFERCAGDLLYELGFARSPEWVARQRLVRAALASRVELEQRRLAARHHLADWIRPRPSLKNRNQRSGVRRGLKGARALI